jgi:hypothetical protein
MYGRGNCVEVPLIRADDQVHSAKRTLYYARVDDVGGPRTTQKDTDCTRLFVLERLDVATNEHSGQEGLPATAPPDLSNHWSGHSGYFAQSEESTVVRPHPAITKGTVLFFEGANGLKASSNSELFPYDACQPRAVGHARALSRLLNLSIKIGRHRDRSLLPHCHMAMVVQEYDRSET